MTLCPSPTLRILPNPEHDPQEFEGLEGLASHIRSRGFYGGVRILQASRSRRSCCCWLIRLPCQPEAKVIAPRNKQLAACASSPSDPPTSLAGHVPALL